MSLDKNIKKGGVTTADIAAHLGIGKSTVAQVLNGRAAERRVSEATRARVHEAARELGYRPNAFARAVRMGRFGTAALIQPLHGLYLPHWLVLGLTEELHKHDMSLTISEAPQSALSEADFLPKVVREVAADGLLINMVRTIPPCLLEALQSLSTPAIWINNKQPFDASQPDDVLAGRMAAEHLLRLGHRHIAFIAAGVLSNEDVHYSVGDRRLGYEQAMRAAGLAPQVLDFPRTPSTWDGFCADTRIPHAVQLLSGVRRPTAVVAYSVDIGMPLLQAAERLNLSLPGDLSLVVFGEGPDRHIGRAVTTVCIDIRKTAHEAVRMLLQKMEAPGEFIESRAAKPGFFDGNTTAPPATAR
jgi:LacI family transcriptional regulator